MFGKQPYEWLRLPETERYIQALCKREAEKQADSNTGKSRITKSRFIKAKRGNAGGTWLHPKLAIAFARWCDVDFAVWCDEQITELLTEQPQWKEGRKAASVGYAVMSEILQATRQAEGKATQSYHYSNEAKMINAALTGRPRSPKHRANPPDCKIGSAKRRHDCTGHKLHGAQSRYTRHGKAEWRRAGNHSTAMRYDAI